MGIVLLVDAGMGRSLWVTANLGFRCGAYGGEHYLVDFWAKDETTQDLFQLGTTKFFLT